MKLTLAEPGLLKDSISIISDLVNEARFKINKDGMELVAMDPANVAMVIFKLLSSSFTEYSLKEDVDLAINLANLKQILRRIKGNDLLTLELAENKLNIILQGAQKRTFSLPIIELEDKEQKIPALEFPAQVKMPSEVLNDSIEDVSIVAESVTFSAEKNTFSIRAEGDLSKAHVDINASDNVSIVLDTDRAKAKYSIEYLKKMIAGSKLSDTVEVHFSQDYPLRIEYKVKDKLLLAFILAPRVEND
jgi:proliferating cell nuclear antigen